MMSFSEKMILFDTHMRFRPAFAGPFTQSVQAQYDAEVAEFADYLTEIPTPADFDSETSVTTHASFSRDALSWALSHWLADAIGDDAMVCVPDILPATFDMLMESVMSGQLQHIQDRLSFLTSSDPLSSLATEF